MHEVGLLRAAVAALSEATEAPVTRVTLAIGAGVDQEAAETAWRTASAGTRLAGARVDWQPGLSTLTCLDCAGSYQGDRLTRCPACQGNGLVTDAAPEIAIVDWVEATPARLQPAMPPRSPLPATHSGRPDRAVWPA